MSPRHPVPSLYRAALLVVIKKVVTSITAIHVEGDLEEVDTYEVYTEELQSISNYLSALPPNISEELLEAILSTEQLHDSIRFCALKLLFNDNINSLVVGIFPKDYYMQILDVINDHGTNLQILDLRGVWVKGDEAQKLQTTLDKLPNLKELYIPHVASDGVLAALGRGHESLLVLDVSGACNISREGIEMLCCFPPSAVQPTRLQIVNIGSPGEEDVATQDVAVLLKNLPELISLGGYSFVGKALLDLSENNGTMIETKLQHLHDTGTDSNVLEAIVKLCPKLESIYLDRPNYGVIERLHLINKLKQVKLNRFDCAELEPFLVKCGEKLDKLELLVGGGVVDVSSVAKHCPNLNTFECYKMEFLTHYEEAVFNNLTRLTIFHSTVSTSCVRYLLTCSPKLEEFSVGDHLDLTDDDISDILGKTELPELRKLWFPSARNLSRITVEVLMITCPKLQCVAELNGWAITPDDMQELLWEIQISNLDLTLWEFFVG